MVKETQESAVILLLNQFWDKLPEKTPKVILRYNNATLKLTKYSNNYVFLTNFSVKKSEQRKGYGSALLNIIKEWADEKNIPIRLDVSKNASQPLPTNTLIQIYEKHRFEVIYQNPWFIGLERKLILKEKPSCN